MSHRSHFFLHLAVLGFIACGGHPPANVGVSPEMAPADMGPQGATAEAIASTEPREQTLDQQVSHVLSRLTFGAKAGDVAHIRQIGVDRWIDQQLHPERIRDDSAEQVMAGYELYNTTPDLLAEQYPPPGQLLAQLGAKGDRSKLSAEDSMRLRQATMGYRRIGAQLQSARVARAVLTDRQLQEVMTDFWLNHFNVYIQKGGPELYQLGAFERDVIRPNALGKFRTLLGAVAKSPAMLFYLDNWESQADSGRPRLVAANGRNGALNERQIQQILNRRRQAGQPIPPGMTAQNAQQMLQNRRRAGLNENYGRELLELHTLGVDGGYTQQDVINVARALTGWTMRQPQQGGEFQFVPAMHDAGEKVVLGHKLPGGRGIEDGEQVLDIVARHPATAKYIAFKLARHFVSDTPSTALVERAAATFRRTDGDIREVMRTIITSPEFFSEAAFRSKVKTPFEVVTSALRALNAQPDTTPRTAQVIALLGQPIYGHQTPNGWPETGDQWMNTGAILNRINFGLAIAANRIPGAAPLNFAGADQLRNAPREQQVDGIVSSLLGGRVSTETRSILISGQNPFLNSPAAKDSSAAAADMQADPDLGDMMAPERKAGRRIPLRDRGFGPLPQTMGLVQIVGLAIGSPEFQRR